MIKPGQIYVVDRLLGTRAGVIYVAGDELEVLEPTGLNPFNSKDTEFWLVKCKFWCPPSNHSVWSTLQSCIDRGLLKLKE